MIDYNPRSWLGVLLTVRGSVVPRLVGRILFTASLGGVALALYDRTKFHLPVVAHTMIGVALGLLLVFRTNASFDRWWEGRKLLGSMVNRSRDLARQFASYTSDDERETARAAVRHLNAAFSTAMQGLRGETDLGVLGELLTPQEREALEPHRSRAPIVLSWISRSAARLSREGKIPEALLLAIDGNVTALVDAIGACERIVRTPVPFAYAHHIKVFVSLWCFTLPFAVVDAMHGLTPIACAILAGALFGIDEIGVEIEDPFGYDPNDLPIERVADAIRSSTRELLESRAP